MTTKHEAALRALEELKRRATIGVWSAGKPGTNVSNWNLAATIRDALTAQGEAEKQLARRVLGEWHDDDCIFCGFKDRLAKQVLDGAADPAPSAPPVPYTTPCPECEGRGFTRRYVDGARESDKCSWCHGGGVVPSAPPARRDE